MNIKIIVATHKAYKMPTDPMYVPLQVGSESKPSLGYERDNVGDNISDKNANYCELTGLYWAWKNMNANYLGLVHYRRYFSKGHIRRHILQQSDVEKLLEKVEVILPKKRNYFIETTYDQYVHAHHEEDLRQTRAILAEKYPTYLPAFDHVMKRTSGHRFNMMIMRRDKLDAYCSWLFTVLGELENRLDISAYSPYDARVFGFVAERLLDIWVETNGIPYTEAPFWYIEKQNWLKKGGAFLIRKMRGKKKEGQKA